MRVFLLALCVRRRGWGVRRIHRRIGPEIHERTLSRTLNDLLLEGAIEASGDRLAGAKGQGP